MQQKRSFFQRLTGGIRLPEKEDEEVVVLSGSGKPSRDTVAYDNDEEVEDGELTIDMYQTANEIIVQTMTAGVRPEDLQINITRDMVTIRGKREANRMIDDGDYFMRELYWGTFSRSILLPQEVEPDKAEAIERNGLLVIKIPKIDKQKKANVKVKSL